MLSSYLAVAVCCEGGRWWCPCTTGSFIGAHGVMLTQLRASQQPSRPEKTQGLHVATNMCVRMNAASLGRDCIVPGLTCLLARGEAVGTAGWLQAYDFNHPAVHLLPHG